LKKEIVGILVCTLLIAATVLPVAGAMNDNIFLEKKHQDLIIDDRFSGTEAQPLDIGTVTVEVLVRGAPVNGANGMKIGVDGNLYIASALGGEIVIMNPKNGKIIKTIISEELGTQTVLFPSCPDSLVSPHPRRKDLL